MGAKELSKEEVAKLPTLLDIVNHYLEGEQRIEQQHESGPFKGLFPTQAYKGMFESLCMEDGTHILMPLSPAQHSYYRGESSYHEDCRPSLYRKGMTDADIFIERIKRCEMELMMQQYPITDLFANSIHAQAPDKTWIPIPFRIGYDGMAQHYGIKTEFMDITLDPWTAAFFAATKYDDATDTYSVIEDTDEYQYGAFYLRNEIPLPNPSLSRIDVVGMQPLSRPGRQSAYVFRMNQGENFNTMAQKDFFRHDADVNRTIFEHANSGNQLFPKELIGERIREEIVKGDEFSRKAFTLAKQRYFPATSEEELQRYLTDKHISINLTDKQWFNETEKKTAIEYWETYQQELFSKIHLRWSYRGPIEYVDGKEIVKLVENKDNNTNQE